MLWGGYWEETYAVAEVREVAGQKQTVPLSNERVRTWYGPGRLRTLPAHHRAVLQ